MTAPQFYFSMDDSQTLYEAMAYGPRWEGWAQPVVTPEVLAQVVTHMDRQDDEMSHTVHIAADGTATVADRYREGHEEEARLTGANYDTVLKPDENGNYLLALGLTLHAVGDED